jgi:hypothetical protein
MNIISNNDDNYELIANSEQIFNNGKCSFFINGLSLEMGILKILSKTAKEAQRSTKKKLIK